MKRFNDIYISENLVEAVEKRHVYVDYQPIVDTLTGRPCALEALARWKDPVKGLMLPEEFIPALENSRLIHILDSFILKTVCTQMGQRRKRGQNVLPVNLNMSRIDFELTDMTDLIEDTVRENGLDPEHINIELTESVAQKDPDLIRLEVDRLRNKGFEVWMDDFGSGYSSLNVLQNYDFNVIKIDMCFLQTVMQNDKTKIILSSIIDMARKLGIKTLAEGVETQDQVSFLKESHCDMIQGFYFGRPSQIFDEMAPATS